MEPVQVRRVERKDPMGNIMGMAQTGLGNTMTGMQVGKGISKAIPWVKSKFATPGTESGGTESAAGGGEGWAAAGPIALGAASGYFQMKANNDYQKKGDKAGNAPYAEKEGPESEGRDASRWGMEAINRRGDKMASERLDPREILSARNSVRDLPLSEPDKINIGNKLSEMLKFIKIG